MALAIASMYCVLYRASSLSFSSPLEASAAQSLQSSRNIYLLPIGFEK